MSSLFKEAYTFDDLNIIPQYSNINSRSICDTRVHFLECTLSVPVIPANMQTVSGAAMCMEMHRLGSIGVLHRFNGMENELTTILKQEKPIRYAISVGIKDWKILKVIPLSHLPRFVVVDVAHGHSSYVADTIARIKELYSHILVPIVAGNVATAEGAIFLAKAGANAVKVGIGNGSLCETRIRTGVGIPQATAIMDVAAALESEGFPHIGIISDGGVKTPGDVAKAIALGADVVMSGSLFAGTKETPGAIKRVGMWPNEQLVKEYAGSASESSKTSNGMAVKNVEGNSKIIPYKGKAERIFNDIKWGLQSAMSYVGATTIVQFQTKSRFVKVTSNGTMEALPYLMFKE